ncbi:MAG: urease accessory protein UreF [Alphaproteobacteria bacterium]|nr:urease accessory protein UreF [Alphaproteobacteria bacterium]
MANPELPIGGLYRLLTWLSPAFPIGAFSYSHGLEAVVAAGAVNDAATLQAWIGTTIRHGGGRIDADLLRDAHRAALSEDAAALDRANRRGIAFRPTAELRLETAAQGAAFLATVLAAWREPFLAAWAEEVRPEQTPSRCPLPIKGGEEITAAGDGGRPNPVCHAVVFGAAAARAGVPLAAALLGYLQAFAGSLVSAGLRLGLIGQTDGQRILAALENVVAGAATQAMERDPEMFGAANFAADIASMAHETQYTRLFRS